MWMTLLILNGCSLLDPERSDAIEYITAVQPLMAENSLLAERTLLVAAGIHDQETKHEDVLQSWATEIVPLAQHLHLQAAQVEVPDTWVDQHGALVGIWSDRSLAYRDLGEAIVLADKDMWDRAKAKHQSAIDKEQAWFQGVGAKLSPMELTLEQYP